MNRPTVASRPGQRSPERRIGDVVDEAIRTYLARPSPVTKRGSIRELRLEP